MSRPTLPRSFCLRTSVFPKIGMVSMSVDEEKKYCEFKLKVFPYSGVARGAEGGLAAPGRRPEGVAKILPMIFLNFYIEKFLKI